MQHLLARGATAVLTKSGPATSKEGSTPEMVAASAVPMVASRPRKLASGNISRMRAARAATPAELEPRERTTGLLPGFEPFAVGKLGYFPYYWLDPSNLNFNAKTYDWINRSLVPGSKPLQQAGLFTDLYLDVISRIYYGYSSRDAAALEAASQSIVLQQQNLLAAWKAAGFPLVGTQPIDGVITTIEQKWATPATTLERIRTASSLSVLLTSTPPSGLPILPILESYISALNRYEPLANIGRENNRYLQAVRDALLSVSETNGGVKINSGDIAPAFEITPAPNIISEALRQTSKRFVVEMTVCRNSKNSYQVTPSDDAAFSIENAPLLALVEASGSTQSLNLEVDGPPVKATLSFTGVTEVFFGPRDFNKTSLKNWYWIKPISDARRNGAQDVTGFRFNPMPQVDFSNKGPFGHLVSIAIAQHPRIKIDIGGQDISRLKSEAAPIQTRSGDIAFLGHPLTQVGDGEAIVKVEEKTLSGSPGKSLKMDIGPAPAETATSPIDRTAFVLGVRSCFPVAGW